MISQPEPCEPVLQVILWGRTEKCLRETAEEISGSGSECHYFVCDVANREQVYQQAKAIREKVLSHLEDSGLLVPRPRLNPLMLTVLTRFLPSGWRRDRAGEQRRRGPREEPDGQRRRRPPQVSARQHAGTVLGEACRAVAAASLRESCSADCPHHFHFSLPA